MTAQGRIVLLGMMGRMRVAGVIWQVLHYLVGLERLGYEAYYVEAHGCTLPAFAQNEAAVAAFIDRMLRRVGLAGRWAFHARNGSGSWYGMSEQQVHRLYGSAAAILNLHGGTLPTPEQSATGRLVYIDTDPVSVQVEIHDGNPFTIDFLSRHCAFFTFGARYGAVDCGLPVSSRFAFRPTRQPVVTDFWAGQGRPGRRFTTVGQWRQRQRVVEYNGEQYHWSKHLEFLKFLDLPRRAVQEFELALSTCDAESEALLRRNGWAVRDGLSLSQDLDTYRQYVVDSRAEFTVAKDQNIRLRTGWFSDRSATYLAAGRPVVTQETGFSGILPAGEGLFGFSTMDEIVAAVEAINGDYERHSRAASRVAREYFSYEAVLPPLLSEIGLGRRVTRASRTGVNIAAPFSTPGGVPTAARRYARALECAGIRANLLDVGEETDSAQAQAAINLICCDIGACFAVRSQLASRLGEDFFRGRYNIGVWAWELPVFPEQWHDRFVYYDEIWAPSSFIASTLSPISPIPVVRIPHVLEIDIPGSRERGRQRLSLGGDEFTFLFCFNGFSSFARKNPLGVIEAFHAAFDAREPARLVIKCLHADFERPRFAEMQARALGRNISIHSEEWSAEEIADLTAACDCYVSLHRAEGVGLTIADAMAAGKPVIATGWSGNMDYMNVANSFPVAYRLRELEHPVAHYPAGGVWAEPSIEDAARWMRYVFEHREEAAARGKLARQEIQANYSRDAVGRMAARRIGLIAGRERFAELKRRLETGGAAADFSDLGSYVPIEHLRYDALKTELRRVVRALVPRGQVLAIVSKGDDDLLSIHAGRAWHFPRGDDGRYAGFYPENSSEAICHLGELIQDGARFLLFPRTAFWWLEHYAGFGEYLRSHCRLAHSDECCRVYELARAAGEARMGAG